MIVEISRSWISSLFRRCSLKELTTAKGDNACARKQRHHSLLASLLGQVCHTNREKRRKKPREMGDKKAFTKLRLGRRTPKETFDREFPEGKTSLADPTAAPGPACYGASWLPPIPRGDQTSS